MLRDRITRALLLAMAAMCSVARAGDGDGGALWPWASQSADDPPKLRPYEIPTFDGGVRDFRAAPPEWVRAPRVDGDAIFAMIIACYPSRSLWRLDVDLQAAVRSTGIADITGTAIGRSYVGIVARMPLYSAVEIDREREREYRRRVDTAKLVADFVERIAQRNRAVRQAALAATMEQRARVRIAAGVADADEQLRYLDKVADAERELIQAEAGIMQARLALASQCRDDAAAEVSEYLARVARLPDEAKP